MLGHDLMEVLSGHSVDGFSREDLDITEYEAVIRALEGYDTVINAAAYTKVDDAETHSDDAFAVNATGPRNIALACREHGARLIHVSTDYVFDGTATSPYREDHPRNPQSVYGKSKAEGEEGVLVENPDHTIIIRTAWLYGANGPNFVATMLKLAAQNETVSVVTDQIGQPTWSRDLAVMIRTLVESDVHSGIFHGTNSGQTSWWGFARVIFEKARLDPQRVLPTTSAEFVRPAPRPSWSVLGHQQWLDHSLPAPRPWNDAFAEAWDIVFENRHNA